MPRRQGSKVATLVHHCVLQPDDSLLIDGAVAGPITHAHDVIVAAAGRIAGNITARRIVIDGEVAGNLRAEVSIRIGAAARVQGELHAPRLDVQPGAQLNCRIYMHGRAQVAKELEESAVHGLLVGNAP